MKKITEISLTNIIFGILTAVFTLSCAGCGENTDNVQQENNTAVVKFADVRDVTTRTMLDGSPEWVTKLPQAETSEQLFIVASYEKNTAWVSMHQKDENGVWQMIMTTPGFIGKDGIGEANESVSLTPQGVFKFDKAFGIAEDPGCIMPYTRVDDKIYWSGDTREGMHYNEMVNIKDVPALNTKVSEHIADYTRQYQYCLNIDYNKDCVPGGGSAFFVHCLDPCKPYTGGCVAIPEDQMMFVMRHVIPECTVIIDTFDNLNAEF